MNRNNNHESVPQMYEKNVRNTKKTPMFILALNGVKICFSAKFFVSCNRISK